MRIISRFSYVFLFLFMLASFSLAQTTDTTRSGSNSGSGTTGSGTTGSGTTDSGTTGSGNTGSGTTGSGSTMGTGSNSGSTTGSMGSGSMGTDTSRTGGTTGNTGSTGSGNMGNTGSNSGTGNMGNTGGTDVTGGTSRSGAGTSTDMAGMIRSSIEDASNRFMQAINSGDINTALQFYSNDATLLPPDLDIIQGTTGIGNFWQKLTSMGMKFDTLTTADVKPSNEGDNVSEVGRYFLRLERPGQTAVTEKGKFLLVWKRQPDNSWKIDTHMWNRSRQ